MSDSARAISDNNATLTYLIHTCIMQYAQCIGLNPKKVQFRNAKLFAWNAKINPFFLACQEEVSWMLKKKRSFTRTRNVFCTILIIFGPLWCVHSALFRNKRILCFMKWPKKTLQSIPYFWNTKRSFVFQNYGITISFHQVYKSIVLKCVRVFLFSY